MKDLFKLFLSSRTRANGGSYTKGTVSAYSSGANRVFIKIQEELGYICPKPLYKCKSIKEVQNILSQMPDYAKLDYKNRNGVVGISHYMNFLYSLGVPAVPDDAQGIEISYMEPFAEEKKVTFSCFSDDNVFEAMDFVGETCLGESFPKLRDHLECIAAQHNWAEFVADLFNILKDYPVNLARFTVRAI